MSLNLDFIIDLNFLRLKKMKGHQQVVINHFLSDSKKMKGGCL